MHIRVKMPAVHARTLNAKRADIGSAGGGGVAVAQRQQAATVRRSR